MMVKTKRERYIENRNKGVIETDLLFEFYLLSGGTLDVENFNIYIAICKNYASLDFNKFFTHYDAEHNVTIVRDKHNHIILYA